MFYDHINAFIKECAIDAPAVDRYTQSFSMLIDGQHITLHDEAPGILIQSELKTLPHTDLSEIYKKMLSANFLGLATNHGVLSIDQSGKTAVLSLRKPMIRSYREFYNSVEDFINSALFLKERLTA